MQFLVETVLKDTTQSPLPCRPPRWITYNYYDRRPVTTQDPTRLPDLLLGQFIEQMVAGAEVACEHGECQGRGRDHELGMMHAQERIRISVSPLSGVTLPGATPLAGELPGIFLWTACQVCAAQSPVHAMHSATRLFSLAKYFELLLYDASFIPSPDICEHDRKDFVRLFALGDMVVELRVASIV